MRSIIGNNLASLQELTRKEKKMHYRRASPFARKQASQRKYIVSKILSSRVQNKYCTYKLKK